MSVGKATLKAACIGGLFLLIAALLLFIVIIAEIKGLLIGKSSTDEATMQEVELNIGYN